MVTLQLTEARVTGQMKSGDHSDGISRKPLVFRVSLLSPIDLLNDDRTVP